MTAPNHAPAAPVRPSAKWIEQQRQKALRSLCVAKQALRWGMVERARTELLAVEICLRAMTSGGGND